MSEYINVFLPGHGIDDLFVTLWTDEAIVLFLQRCILADQTYFPEGQSFALASFQTDAARETGTGRYLKSGGTIQVEHETGSLRGLLNRVGFSAPHGQARPSPSEIAERVAEIAPSVAEHEPLPKRADDVEE